MYLEECFLNMQNVFHLHIQFKYLYIFRNKTWYPDAEFYKQFEGPCMYPELFPHIKWRPKRYKGLLFNNYSTYLKLSALNKIQ